MSTIQSGKQLLISSLLATRKRRTATSFLYVKDCALIIRKNLPFFLFIVIFFSATANGTAKESSNLIFPVNAEMKRSRQMDDSFNDLTYLKRNLLTYSCVKCLPSEKINWLFEQYENLRLSALVHSLQRCKRDSTGRTCGKLSYTRCLFLYNLTKNIIKTFKAQTINKSNDFPVERPLTKSNTTSNFVAPQRPIAKSPSKSRKRRLAAGDRRLVHMYCRTNFVLEILNDGRVVGNPTKTDNAILEIQPVAPRGVVRFYSPSTQYFLAMNNRGRLYGTKTYNEENCAFTERIHENWWSTYSSQALPRKKTHRLKRSTDHAWYVAIGKTGLPRKASRIRPSQTSAQFLPRPTH